MTLGEHIVVDAEEPNNDKFSRVTVDSEKWQKELDKIANVLNKSYIP